MKRFAFCLLSLCVAAGAFAQAPQLPPLPVDEAVRIGQLDNGLTYYVRHNEEPKGQANFYIAQKVGSILEEEDQRGLAHFLEHMCFNGTVHFPGNGVIEYCESIGVKFGNDINAYTSIDETVYNIDNVPVANFPTSVDSCLLILHDWAGALLLEDEDIDKERGVIHEEWRSRQGAQMRMYDKILPEIYPGNKYGVRLPIGTMEVVDNFPYEALRSYYKTWYRPDQQGIIVVGDIDVDEVEAKIKDVFSTLPASAEDAPERYYLPIEKNVEPIISIASDKEQQMPMAYIFKKHDAVTPEQKGDLSYLLYEYALAAADVMTAQRLGEMAQKADPDFIEAVISDDDFFLSKTEGAYTGIVAFNENSLLRSVTSLYREMLRVQRNGFTASEYDRARQSVLSTLETQYNQRSKKTSGEYCREYVRHFIDNDPIMGIENEFNLLNQLAPNISVEMVNQLIASLIEEDNLVVVCMLPEKEDVVYPTEEELKSALAAVEAEDIAPYEDKTSDEPLISKKLKPGKVVKTEEAPFGYTLLTLKNGAKVYFRQTDFNPGEVIFSANSYGGKSLYSDDIRPTLQSVEELMAIGGRGNFSATELSKALAGKQVSLRVNVSEYGEGVRGKSAPKDFETLLQLNYLNFTSLRKDEQAFESWKTRQAAALANEAADPMSAFMDSLNQVYARPIARASLKLADLEKVDYDLALKIARERFDNAADFSFYITGAIDLETAKPLIEKYIGSLKGNKRKVQASCKEEDLFKQADTDIRFERAMGTPMATSILLYNAGVGYDLHNELALDVACQTLSMTLLSEIREKEGLTYSIGAYGAAVYEPKNFAYMQVAYSTNPDKVDFTEQRVDEIIADFTVNGPSQENLAKAKEYLAKNYKANQTENSYFESVLKTLQHSGVDTDTDYLSALDAIGVEDVKAAVKTLVDGYRASVVIVGTEE